MMTTCRDCGREISERARTCPGCGAPGPAAGTVTLGTAGPVPAGAALASYGSRVGAFLLDAAILTIPVGVLVFSIMGAAMSTRPAVGFSVIPVIFIWVIASVLYKPLMEGAKGATLGKMMVGIKVVAADTGARCDYGKAFLRWLIGAVINIVPFGFFVDVLWPLWDERRQALHDKVAGTLVVSAR